MVIGYNDEVDKLVGFYERPRLRWKRHLRICGRGGNGAARLYDALEQAVGALRKPARFTAGRVIITVGRGRWTAAARKKLGQVAGARPQLGETSQFIRWDCRPRPAALRGEPKQGGPAAR